MSQSVYTASLRPRLAGAGAGLLLALLGVVAAAEPGLVLWLSFEALAGKVFTDGSGAGNEGQVLAGTRVKGVNGAGLDVSTAGASVLCEDSPSLKLTRALTLAAWVCPKSKDTGSFGTVIRKDEAYALRFDGSKLGLLLWCGGKVNYLHSPALDLRPGTWLHLAGTYDGDRARLYVDGKEVAVAAAALPGEIDASGSPCCIGSCRGQNAFTGTIDEAKVYAHALSAQEIAAAHQAGVTWLREQAAVPIPAVTIGTVPQAFRKPPREARMVVPGYLWLDAEDFADYGGWVLDTQFVHLMGSAYLLAAGVGRPVADAQTDVEVTQAGTYRVWVRSRNWVREHAPGQFTVRLDGKGLPKLLGKTDAAAWTWELAGERELATGKHSLALHDMTGYYGRCDAILLTTDSAYTPPAEREALCQERARLCGFTLEPEPAGEFDVIVVGAGPAGCPAALAAARLGARTALVQNRPVLGGNASDECGVPLNGAASAHPNARETGLAEEVSRVRARYGYRGYSEPFRLLTEAEKTLQVFVNRHVYGVEMTAANRIAAVHAVDTLTGRLYTYRGKLFIDCTGDGWVGYYAKAESRLGREARSEFDENLAPETADALTMSGCLMGNALGFRASDAGQPLAFARPPWAREITRLEGPGRNLRSITSGEWWLEHPNDVDDIWQAEEARDELIKVIFSYWDYIKNRSTLKDKAATYRLDHIPIMDAKRESRRLVGDYILTQNDCQGGRVFPDRISYGGWPLDVHHPEGIYSGEKGSFWCNAPVPIYTIPYRCLYSKNIDNLLFAGRCASVTHIALGSIRVESTLATLGQAAGTAAALCVTLDTTPRGIYQNHLGTLQQTLLKHDQTIPGTANEDPADLARGAKAVTASSTATFVEVTAATLAPETAHPLNCDRGMLLPAATLDRLRALSLYLGNTGTTPAAITLHLRAATTADDTAATQDLATVTAPVPAGRESWVSFALDTPISSPFVWFWIGSAEGVTWRLMSTAPEGCSRVYGNAAAGTWTRRPGECYALKVDPPLRVAAEFAAANVINGTARTWGGKSNLWASDPRQPLPQWLALDFASPITVNTAYLTFDSNLAPRLPGPGNARETVRDYTLSIRNGAAWQEVAQVKGNFQRHNTVRFPPVPAEAVRVTVQATNGDASARIFEVRLYNE
jgi:hypothetical protein